jgi:hypothetical protein
MPDIERGVRRPATSQASGAERRDFCRAKRSVRGGDQPKKPMPNADTQTMMKPTRITIHMSSFFMGFYSFRAVGEHQASLTTVMVSFSARSIWTSLVVAISALKHRAHIITMPKVHQTICQDQRGG